MAAVCVCADVCVCFHLSYVGTLSPLYQCRTLFIVAHVLVQYAGWDYRYDIVAHALLALLLACIDLLGYKIKQELGE